MNTTQKKTRIQHLFSLLLLALITISSFFITTCKAPFGLGGQVDIALPVVTIIEPQPNSYFGRSFKVRGKAEDDIEVKAVYVDILQNNEVKTTVPATYSDGSFFAEVFTLDENDQVIVPDGQVTLRVRALDQRALDNTNDSNIVRQSGVSNVAVIVDNRAPTTLVTVPQFLAEPGEDLYPLTSTYFVIKGEAWDPSGIAKVDVLILDVDQKVLARKTAEGTASWMTRFTYGNSTDFPIALANGLYSYRVIVTDKAGNNSSAFYHYEDIAAIRSSGSDFPSVDEIGRADQLGESPPSGSFLSSDLPEKLRSTQFRIDSNEDNPKIRFSNITGAMENGDPKENVIAKFSSIFGTVIDDKDGIDKDSFTVRITPVPETAENAAFDVPVEALILDSGGDTNSVNFQIFPTSSADLEDYDAYIAEGIYKITVSVSDDKTPAAMNSDTTILMVDSTVPSFESVSPSPRATTTFLPLGDGNIITVTVDVADDNPLPDDAVSFTLVNILTAESLPLVVPGVRVGATNTFRLDYDLSSYNIADPLHVIIQATDSSGKTAFFRNPYAAVDADKRIIVYTVSTDFPENPVITLPAPPVGGVLNWVGGDSVSIRGTTGLDNGTNKADRVYFYLGSTSLDPAAIAKPFSGSEVWTLGSVYSSASVLNWNGTLSFLDAGVPKPEGTYRLFVFSQNSADNFSQNPAWVDFWYDNADPEITETGTGIPDSELVYRNSALAFAGAATDSNGIDSVVVSYRKNNGASVTLLEDTDGDAAWAVTLPANPDHSDDGSYVLTFTVKDIAGKTSGFTRNIVIDTKKPELTITAPVANEGVSTSAYTVLGTVNDGSGKGVSSLQYSLDSTDGTNGSWMDLSPALNWSALNVDFSSGGQGAKALWVRASDGLNVPAAESVNFFYDTADPLLSETVSGLSTDQVIRNAAVSFGGAASDTNSLASVKVSLNGAAAQDVTGPFGSWSYTLPTTPNGDFTLVFTATDIAGRSATVTRRVFMDNTVPALPVINAFSGTYVVNELVASGTASDPGAAAAVGLQDVQYRFNDTGAWTNVTGSNNWFQTIDVSGMAEGTHELNVRAVDRVGNISTVADRSFIIDRANPLVTVAAAYDGIVYRSADFTISGTVTDSLALHGSTPISVSAEGPGGSIDLSGYALNFNSGDGSWSRTIPVAQGEGTYTITITGRDSVNRLTTLSRTVLVDTEAPGLLINNLTENQLISQTSYIINGTADDGSGSGVATVEYSLDGGTTWLAALGTNTWTVALDSLAETLSTNIQLRSRDQAANESAVIIRNFQVDTADPVIEDLQLDLVNFTSGIKYKNSDYTISLNATDSLELAGYTITRNGTYIAGSALTPLALTGTAAPLSLVQTVGGSGLADGNYEYVITLFDAVDKTASVTRTIMVDTTQPDLAITAPVVDEYVESNTYTIRGTVTDNDGKGVSLLAYSINSTDGVDGDWVSLTPSFNWNAAGIDFGSAGEGSKILWVRAGDGLNALRVVSVSLYYDTAAPELTETTINTGSQQLTNGTLTFDGEASDTNELLSLGVSLNGAAAIPITVELDDSWTYTLPAVNGDYTLVFTAEDIAGRTTSLTRRALTDVSAPALPVINVFTGSYVTNSLVASGTAADNGAPASGLAVAEYRFNSTGVWSALSGTENWFGTLDVSALAQGNHTLDVRTTDRAGNVSTEASRSFTIDRADPVLTINAAYTGTVYRSSAFTIDGSVIDTLGLGASPVSVSIDGPSGLVDLSGNPLSYNSGTGAWSQTVPITQGQGTYTLTIIAADAVGRSVTATRTVIVDTAAPSLTISNLTENQLIQSSSYTISGTAADGTGSGVALVQYSLNGGITWLDATGTTSWTILLDPLAQTLAGNILLRTSDQAGNQSGNTSRNFRVDTADPALAVTAGNTAASLVYLNSAILLSGTATDANTVTSVVVSYSYNGAATVELLNDTDNNGVWSTSLSPLSDGSQDGEYVFTIMATDGAGKTTMLIRQVQYDTTVPSANYTTVTPLLDGNIVNGKVTVRAAVADETSLNTVHWALLPSAASPIETDYVEIVSGSKTSPQWVLDTTQATANVSVNGTAAVNGYLSDGQASRLWVRARDRAGNETLLSLVLNVDEASDYPAIEFIAIDTSAATPADSYKNLIESSAVLRFTISDDDMIQASSIEIRIDGGSWIAINRNGGAALTDSQTLTTSHNLSLPTTITEGTHYFELRVSDLADAKSGLTAVSTTLPPVYVMVDRSYPIITETELNASSVFRSALFSIGGTIADTNSLKSLVVVQTKDGDPGSSQTVLSTTGLSGVSDSWTIADMPFGGVSDGTYEYVITVTDASDKQTVLTRTVVIDTTAPGLPGLSSPVADSWLRNNPWNFSGTSSDGTGSGIAAVKIAETANAAAVPLKTDPVWADATIGIGGAWNHTVTIAATGTRTVHLYAIDVAGNESAIIGYDFGLDQSSPVVSFSDGTGIRYVNSLFTISGNYSDDSGLAGISVESSDDNITFIAADPATASFNSGAGTWSWTKDPSAQAAGTWYYRFNFTDLAGNVRQETKTVNLDRTEPVLAYTASAPSINFNAGAGTATANALMSLSGSVSEDQGLANLSNLRYRLDGGSWVALTPGNTFTISSIDVSGKYPSGTMLVEVEAADRNGNTAIESFTFNVDQVSDKPVPVLTTPAEAATINLISISITGTVTDDDGINAIAGSIQYRYSDTGLPGNYGPWTDILSISGPETSRNYSVNINSGSDGVKLLQVRSYDKFGVVSDTITRNFSVDTGAPQFSALAPAMNSYHNNDFAVTGSVTDNTDVQTLRYRVTRDGIEVTAWTVLGGTPATTVPINQNISTAAGSGQYEVFLEASDGTYTRTTSIRVYVDKSAPTVTFVSPAAATVQNNIITLSGTATDNYGIASLEFFIVDTGAVEHALPTGTLSGTLSWTISGFDTRNATLLSYAEDLGSGLYEITVRAKASDQAGNLFNSSGVSDLVFRFRQTDDRPVLAIDNVALDGSSLIDTTTITGTLQDDDGVATILIDTWNVGNSTATPDVSETVTLTSGALGGKNLVWRINLANTGNGLRGMRVRVIDTVDNNGQNYGVSDWSRLDTGRIDFRLDTIAPAAAFTTPLANSTWSSKNTFSVSGSSSDANGISGLKYKLDDNDFSSGTVAIVAPLDNWSFVIDQADLNDGPHTIYVQATDASGKTKVVSRQISVDKTGPDISVISPLNNAAVFGPLTISGTATDNAGGAGVKNIKIGLGNTIDATSALTLEASTWTDIAGTTSWSYSFLNINDFANTTYSVNTGDLNADGIEDVGETWTDLWNFKFYVRSEDNAGAGGAGGNISYLTAYNLQIDPKRDRPEVSILSPTDGATVGGFVRVFGSAFDSQFVEKVQIAISSDSDADYTNDALWTQGTLDETEAGVRWYLVSGTTSWNVRLNEAAEFDPTGGDTINTIRFKVRAKDYKVAPGDGIYGNEVEYSITFNKNFPQFSAMSINSGDTVGGTVIFEGLVRDESDIARIVFSNEGPLLNNTTIYTNPDPSGVAVPGLTTTEVSSVANPYGGADITVSLLGTTDPEYSAAFPASYRIYVPINTAAAGLYNNGAGSMSIKLTAEDNTTPQPFTNQYLVSFSVDNILPVNLAWTGGSELVGTSASLKGSVRDTGAVSGIDRVVVYLTNLDGELVSLKGSGSPIAVFDPLDVLDELNSGYDDYRMVINNRLEDGNDGGSAGDNDGIPEWLVFSGGIYYWEGRFDSTRTASADGKVSVHMVAEDFASNQTILTADSFIANNKPYINSIVLGTDLNGDGDTDDVDEKSTAITSGYSATNFMARGNLLYIKVNAASGNGALRYSVKYNDIERNIGDLTDNEILIDTSGITDSTLANDRSFVILVYDTTDAGSADPLDQLSASITVNLTVDNVDTVPPLAELQQLTADDIKTTGTNPVVKLGHIEPWNQSPWNNTDAGFDKANEILGNDADVSGTIILRGKVSDDQRLTEVLISIDLNADGDFDDTVGGIAETQQVATVDGNGLLIALANTLGSVSFSNQTLSQDSGHEADFAFEWDSKMVAGVARANVTLAVQARDARSTPNVSVDLVLRTTGTGANPDTINSFQIDVVPYISRIDTGLGMSMPNNPSVFNRTALGRYPVWRLVSGTVQYEVITVSGFNLMPDAGNRVVVDKSLTGLNATLDGYSATAQLVDPGMVVQVVANNQYTVSMTDIVDSGYLNFITITDGIYIPTLNSLNDNDQTHNQEPNNVNNDLLRDDRYLDVWDMRKLSFGDIRNVDMRVDGNTINWGMGYTDNRAGVSVNGAAATELRRSYTRYFDSKLAYNSASQYFFVSQSGDTLGVPVTGWTLPSHFGLNYRAAPGNSWEYGNTASTRKLFIESNWNGAEINKLDRVQFPDLRVVGNAAQSLVYMSYYDAMQRVIKFRLNQIGTNALPAGFAGTTMEAGVNMLQVPYQSGAINWAATEQAITRYNNGNQYDQGYVAIAGAGANSPFSAVAATSTGTAAVFWFDAVDNSLKMKYNTAPATAFSGYQEFTNAVNPAVGTYSFKLRVDGQLVNSGNDIQVVVVTPAQGNRRYELAYRLNQVISELYGAFAEVNPVTQRVVVRSMQTGIGSTISIEAPTSGTSLLGQMGGVMTAVPGTGTAWTERTLDNDFAGKYVVASVDGNDAFHIAYQKTSTGDLRYMKLADVTDTATPIVVDSFLQVGQYIDITTRIEDVGAGNQVIPYITYFNISNADTRMSAKIARLVIPPTSPLASLHGADSNDRFTGAWEVSIIPAREVPKQFRINVGVTLDNRLIVGYAGDLAEYGTYKP